MAASAAAALGTLRRVENGFAQHGLGTVGLDLRAALGFAGALLFLAGGAFGGFLRGLGFPLGGSGRLARLARLDNGSPRRLSLHPLGIVRSWARLELFEKCLFRLLGGFATSIETGLMLDRQRWWALIGTGVDRLRCFTGCAAAMPVGRSPGTMPGHHGALGIRLRGEVQAAAPDLIEKTPGFVCIPQKSGGDGGIRTLGTPFERTLV